MHCRQADWANWDCRGVHEALSDPRASVAVLATNQASGGTDVPQAKRAIGMSPPPLNWLVVGVLALSLTACTSSQGPRTASSAQPARANVDQAVARNLATLDAYCWRIELNKNTDYSVYASVTAGGIADASVYAQGASWAEAFGQAVADLKARMAAKGITPEATMARQRWHQNILGRRFAVLPGRSRQRLRRRVTGAACASCQQIGHTQRGVSSAVTAVWPPCEDGGERSARQEMVVTCG